MTRLEQPLRRRNDWFGSLSNPSMPRVDRDEHGRRLGFAGLEWSCDELPVTFARRWQPGAAGSGAEVRNGSAEPDEHTATQLDLLD